jgi:23S rRNA pseudouridine2605 synthase
LKIKNLRPAKSSPSPKKPLPAPTVSSAPGERLQKLLAAAGLGSRREIETWIEAGRVTIDGQPAKLGDRAQHGSTVAVDGKPVNIAAIGNASAPRVILYHKPVGELVTRSDPQGRATVFSRLPPGRWVAVGRLDINSAGLLLLTDSGELANRLMHPRYEIEREYAARVQGVLRREDLEQLRAGVQLADGVAAFTGIEVMQERHSAGINRWYRVRLREGRNREVRRLFEAVGARVSRLIRVRHGPVELPRDLEPGKWRELPADRVQELLAC